MILLADGTRQKRPKMYTKDSSVITLALKAFPGYTGKKFEVESGLPSSVPSYWDGGSKDSWVFIDLDTKKTIEVWTNHPFFEPDKPSKVPENLPQNIAIVRHCIFCGKDMGLTVFFHPSAITPFLPAPSPELTENQAKTLSILCGLVSSARKEAAIRAFGNLQVYEALKAELNGLGLVNDKLNTATMEGKNIYREKYFQKFILF